MPHEIDIEIGSRIRAARHLRGLLQSDLGKAIGVQFQTIHKYETGANRVSCSRIILIADVLNVPVTDFLTGITGTPQKPESGKDRRPNLWVDPKDAAILAATNKLDEQQREAFLSLLFEIAKETK